tara:strand:- start:1174 stop:2862 length:1689 start_codon:yes stop_codon:yes gene_type:complete
MNILTKSLLTTAVLGALSGCVSTTETVLPTTCAEAGDSCKTFTLLHTNDNHGRFWENKYGEYGMAARKTVIDSVRSEVAANGGEVLLLSGGDINTGVPESDLLDAKPDFIGMNAIGYDAMAVGNHEFDNPLSVVEIQRELANFPMLAANIYDKATGKRYFDAYKIFTVNGIKIAVIGLTTEDTVKIGNPEFVSGLTFTDPTTEIKKVIKEINKAGTADVIFAATHMGHYEDGKHGSNAPGDVAMTRALKVGDLQLVVGGHSQNPVCMEPKSDQYADFKAGDECKPDQQNGTYIMQAHEWGKYVGRADFEYFNDQLHLVSYKLIPVNLKAKNKEGERVLIAEAITPNSDLLETLRVYQEQGQEKLTEVIASTSDKLDGERNSVRGQQTNMGQLIATAQATKVNADIGIMNSGGVRASIDAGNITYKDVLTVQPFGNSITKSMMTGAQVSEYLNTVATQQIGSGSYAQFIGVSMTVDCKAGTVDISDINGKGYNAGATYSFTLPSYNAAGGDGYPKLKPIMTGYVDAEVLYTFLKDKGTIKAGEFTPSNNVVYANSLSEKGCQL